MILALLAVLVLAVTVLGGLALVTVAPFVRAVDAAERRGFSPARWGWVAAVGCAVGLAVGTFAARGTQGLVRVVLLVVGALVAWAVPLALALIGPHQVRLGGRAGAHER